MDRFVQSTTVVFKTCFKYHIYPKYWYTLTTYQTCSKI